MSAPTFFTVPQEIRDLFYQQALGFGNNGNNGNYPIITLDICPWEPHDGTVYHSASSNSFSLSSFSSLCRVSKQVREEARLIFFESTHFKIRFGGIYDLKGERFSAVDDLLMSIRSLSISADQIEGYKPSSAYVTVRIRPKEPKSSEKPLRPVTLRMAGKGDAAIWKLSASPPTSDQTATSAAITMDLLQSMTETMEDEVKMGGLQLHGLLKMIHSLIQATGKGHKDGGRSSGATRAAMAHMGGAAALDRLF
ncbi:hypothetical protein LTR36_004862 [Oleoguttula mirabilis]|uniref:F-box domain-containing protein n=1 Tax=Oleoguttula mirabilis TaxID=1507867 RepID=A0AAV9JG28_9PEZI|nr:hypothetical protein LTR36_004862 [Oleoguttula mirabilis]